MKLILGDCLQKLSELPTSTIDCVVTDPPYGWRFMGKAWDGADIEAIDKAAGAEREEEYLKIAEARIVGTNDCSAAEAEAIS